METISDKIAESGFEMHKEQFARHVGVRHDDHEDAGGASDHICQ